jgi:rhodanese-related sulfurtransferase
MIDCRSKFTYDIEHANGSVNLTLSDVINNPEKVFSCLRSSKNKDLLLYCSSSNCNTSQKVAEYLRYSGKNIYIYKGGWSMIREFFDRDKIVKPDDEIR